MWIFGWIILSIVCASVGSDRQIGAVGAFFASLFLSPLIGFILVFTSDKIKLPEDPKWNSLIEQAEIENYKGNKLIAIDKYKEALYWMEKKHAELPKERSAKLFDKMDGIKMIISKIQSETKLES
jgi:hypothetical protein